jgi:cyclophilin family peptidyl-prolyl cis-trans isomerase
MTKRKVLAMVTAIGGAVAVGTAPAQTNEAKKADLPDGLYAKITTARGVILCRMEFEKTPLTVCSFVGLAEGKLKTAVRQGQPFFDGLTFHRVVRTPSPFVIQGGCPLGNGTGDPGYRFPDEIVPSLKHDGPGLLSMANAGPGTNGSQFFITLAETPWLNGKHTVFGKVMEGMDVVNRIQQGDKMTRVEILRVGEKAKAFLADQATFDSLLKAKAGR